MVVPNAHLYIARANVCPRVIQSHILSQPYVLSRELLLPQFFLMALGETLFTMTGLAFSFSEVSKVDSN